MRAVAAPGGVARRVRTAVERWLARAGSGRGEGAARGPRAAPQPPLLVPEEAYARWAPSYGSPPTRLQELEADAREGLLPPLWGARVLDLGCGTGRVTWRLLERGASLAVGLDLAPAMLRRAATLCSDERAAWVAGRADALPFREGAFDAVVCALVLGHLPRLEPALAEVARVAAPRATVLVSGFHPAAAARGWERTFVEEATGRTWRVEHHAHPLERFRELLAVHGFAVDALAEPEHDGTPVVFVLRARREGRP